MITLLAASGAIVVCAGGGGIPVTMDAVGTLHGAEAVIDKDLSARSWPGRSTPTCCCC